MYSPQTNFIAVGTLTNRLAIAFFIALKRTDYIVLEPISQEVFTRCFESQANRPFEVQVEKAGQLLLDEGSVNYEKLG